jgi:hypothetical protein
MNGRTRLLNMLHGQPKVGLSWTSLVDDTTCSVMPQALRDMPTIEFYKYIGCDIHYPQPTRAELFAFLEQIYTLRLREGNFSLAIVADGLPTPLERFLLVREWMDKNQN